MAKAAKVPNVEKPVGKKEQEEAAAEASESAKKSGGASLKLKLKDPTLSYYDPATGNTWYGDRVIETPHTPYVSRALGGVLVQVEDEE